MDSLIPPSSSLPAASQGRTQAGGKVPTSKATGSPSLQAATFLTTFKTPCLPSFEETNLRADSCFPDHVTRNKNPFLDISLAFQFLFGPPCVAGKEPVFLSGNTLRSLFFFPIKHRGQFSMCVIGLFGRLSGIAHISSWHSTQANEAHEKPIRATTISKLMLSLTFKTITCV